MNVREELKKIYLDPIKENPQSLIGIELEFPIVNLSGLKTDIRVSKGLFRYLEKEENYKVKKRDTDLCPIELEDKGTGDLILFEVAYSMIEFALAPTKEISQSERNFLKHFKIIQDYLSIYDHAIQGKGIHPNWQDNKSQTVNTPRYLMLLDFLSLSAKEKERSFHSYPHYGTFICGNQVQLDVSKSNYLRVLNAFNKIEAAKAYLFANSYFQGENWDTKISRDIFWEDSMHGYYEENVGLFDKDFEKEEDFLALLEKTAIFTTSRHEKQIYFYPHQVKEFFNNKSIEGYDLNGVELTIMPTLDDLQQHRAYHYQSLTRRGTVEFRSVCAQPLTDTFAPAAFHLGLLSNLENLEKYLTTSFFFEKYGRNYKSLRRRFSKLDLTLDEEVDVKRFSKDLYEIGEKGLISRGFGEESYLKSLSAKIST